MMDRVKKMAIESIDEKLKIDENFIRYSFYELRIKDDLSESETNRFLEICSNYFKNKGYNVYLQGDKFVYDNSNRVVQDNEMMIAIKPNK